MTVGGSFTSGVAAWRFAPGGPRVSYGVVMALATFGGLFVMFAGLALATWARAHQHHPQPVEGCARGPHVARAPGEDPGSGP